MSRKRDNAKRQRELKQRAKEMGLDTDRCSACGKSNAKIRGAGMWCGDDGVRLPYALCSKCAAAFERGGAAQRRVMQMTEFYLGVDRAAGEIQ